jgi:hypothetical protein
MSVDKFPNREIELPASLQKWFSSIYSAFRNVSTEGDVTVDSSSRGLVLKDSAGVYWRITVSTSGTVTSANLGTTKPQGV